jgi:phosphate starvation-inducible membrane PsiE
MHRRHKFITFSFLSLIVGFVLLKKYFELKGFIIDGAGIGVYLGFIEINDRVPKEQVLTYANAFLIISILFFVVCSYALYKAINQKNID